jgi:hypothetical protein
MMTFFPTLPPWCTSIQSLYPETVDRLSINSDIVEDPVFESAVVKLMDGKIHDLSVMEI